MAQAMSGIMSVTGHPSGAPAKAGVPVADIGCALFAAYGILSAYIGRLSSGKGQYIDASLFDSALAFSIWDVSEYWGTGKPPTPVGTSNKMAAPYQAVKAADGWLVMGATNQKLWALLCKLMERNDLVVDDRFATNSNRLANREILIAELEKTFALRSASEWIALLLQAGIPAGPLLGYPEALDSPHGKHRKMRMDIDHPVEGKVPNIGFAVKFSATPPEVRRAPPLLAQHTEEVLGELGIGTVELSSLRSEGAFAA
jgi:formyl-CoA transferase